MKKPGREKQFFHQQLEKEKEEPNIITKKVQLKQKLTLAKIFLRFGVVHFAISLPSFSVDQLYKMLK